MKHLGYSLHKKSIFFTFIFSLVSATAFSQAMDITFDLTSYAGGYHVSCNGATNGHIDATIVNGTSPYTYLWSTGATTQNLNNIGAGTYTLTVSDNASHTKTKSVTLLQSATLQASLTASQFPGGFNISKYGGSNGMIGSNINGGAPPYTYLWSNGATVSSITNLTIGSYTVTVADANQCSVQQSKTLTQPPVLQITSITSSLHNGYNVSCRNGSDANINITVTGGVPPYSFQWSNGSFNQNLTNLASGTYNVLVTDTNNAFKTGQITLTQPTAITITSTPSTYPDGYNVSCYHCYNGSITTSVTGGISPYTYLWNSGQTTLNLSTLGGNTYNITVTDANACTKQNSTALNEPESNDWATSGNLGINPSSRFIGTTDTSSIAFRTNNNEAMRIKNNGNVGIGTNSPQEKLHVGGKVRVDSLAFQTSDNSEVRLLGVNPSGVIRGLTITAIGSTIPVTPCISAVLPWFHNTCSGPTSNIFLMPSDGKVGIGPDNPLAKLDILSDGSTTGIALQVKNNISSTPLLKVTDNGKIGIGDAAPSEKLSVNGNVFVNGTIMGKRSTGALFLCANTGSTDGADIELYGPGGDRPNQVSIIGDKIVFGHYVGGNWPPTMQINENGQVGINWDFPDNRPTNSDFKLCINGKIYAQGQTIKLSQYWPDYVFNKNYSLMSIYDLKNFIEKNGHLPGIPTAEEIKQNGIDVEQISIALVQKVEELSLYIIKLQKEMDNIKQKVNEK